MEIGALIILVIIGLLVVWGEKTKIGNKFSEWGLKNLMGINVDELED